MYSFSMLRHVQHTKFCSLSRTFIMKAFDFVCRYLSGAFDVIYHLILRFLCLLLWPDDLSFGESGVFKLSTIIWFMLICVFKFISFLWNWVCQILVHMFIIVIFSWLTYLLIWMKCSSLSFLTSFSWKSVLWDIKMTIPACGPH